ncbi:PREDICTED: uncharacterized protein LOC109207393 [Nicotiana attenuata]|uniref:uncharacterized protein LOC109207393 n=1 Tax=Nicotiana attenuata TaxID=49451 RepID=UPI0009051856|nr:PREDICTED: uncharacterized protein LOC109207393 [Nicotiana attenuata]
MVSTDFDVSSVSGTLEFIHNPSSPLFVQSSDVPGVSLVPVPFSRMNFGGWKRSIIVSLSARNKIAFVDGSLPKPPDNSVESKQWDRCNNTVISWLTSSLSPDIADSVQYSETAEEIWRQLNKKYETVNGTKAFQLKKELASTCQGSLDIASYFNKLKKLWDELRVVLKNHGNHCTCGAKEGILKEEEDRLHQFLMGLNEVICFHCQNESQSQPNYRPPGSNTQRQYVQRVNFDQANGNLFYRYCKKNGHSIDKCFKLHGFPPDFKFTKRKKIAANAILGIDFSSDDCTNSSSFPAAGITNNDSQGSLVPGLTKQQYSQLMALLQHSHASDSAPSQFDLMASTNFVGNALIFKVVTCSLAYMLLTPNFVPPFFQTICLSF